MAFKRTVKLLNMAQSEYLKCFEFNDINTSINISLNNII